MSGWQPEPNGLNDLLGCLKLADEGDSDTQRAVLQRMESFTLIPDYTNYLAYIFTQLPNEPENVRWRAGLTLKNNIRTRLEAYTPQVIAYLKEVIFLALADQAHFIRATAASVIDWLYRGIGPENWPEALEKMLQMAESDNKFAQEGAMKALSNMCQEIPRYLANMEINGDRPFNYVLPRVIRLLGSENPKVRIEALVICNQFIEPPTPPNGLSLHQDAFLQEIFKLASDTNTDVRKLVCQAFNALLASWADKLIPSMKSIIDFMLYSTQDQDENVALQAAEFWLTFVEEPDLPEHLRPHLDTVIPVLLKGMVYSDFDQAVLDQDNEDQSVPDKESDIKPKHFSGKTHGSHQKQDGTANGSASTSKSLARLDASEAEAAKDDEDEEDEVEDDEDDDEDEEDPYANWTVRKCCAAALDMMASTFQVEILPILLPYLQRELESQDWKQREAGILALGAVAEGCMEGVQEHLESLVPFLFDSLKHEKPLVRSISCWTLGRYSAWCLPTPEKPDHKQRFFEPTIQGLLAATLDTNKRVQEAGCSAFATVEEIAGEELVPYLPVVLPTLVSAFQRYQQKNLLILYDAIGTLADAVGTALNQPQYIDTLMPPLIAKWQSVDDLDSEIIPLLECLSSVVLGLGSGFHSYAPPVFERCVSIVRQCLQAYQAFQADNSQEVDEPDRTHLIVALDLLSGLTQALGESIQPYYTNSNPPLMQLMIACFSYPEPPVKQSAFALLGDCAMSCFPLLQPLLPEVMPAVISSVIVDARQENVSVCNNAAWCAGEIALKHGAAMEQYAVPLMERLVPLLLSAKAVRSLTENAAVTIGRLALVCPQAVAPHLNVFIKNWCDALAEIKDNEEKDSAFRGICLAIQTNPPGVAEHFGSFLHALVRWRQPSPALSQMFRSILHGLKEMSGAQQWDAQMAQLPAPITQKLREVYGV